VRVKQGGPTSDSCSDPVFCLLPTTWLPPSRRASRPTDGGRPAAHGRQLGFLGTAVRFPPRKPVAVPGRSFRMHPGRQTPQLRLYVKLNAKLGVKERLKLRAKERCTGRAEVKRAGHCTERHTGRAQLVFALLISLFTIHSSQLPFTLFAIISSRLSFALLYSLFALLLQILRRERRGQRRAKPHNALCIMRLATE
jgi:hypothetical protein